MPVTVVKLCKGCSSTVIRSVVHFKQRAVISSKRPFKPQSIFLLGWHPDTPLERRFSEPTAAKDVLQKRKIPSSATY